MRSTLFSLLYLSTVFLQFPVNAQQTTATVPILDWGFDFAGSDVSVLGASNGSTTYQLTCNEPKRCSWTQDATQLTDGFVGTLTFIEGPTPYQAAMTQNLSAVGPTTLTLSSPASFSFRAKCTPWTGNVTLQRWATGTGGSESGRSVVTVTTRYHNLVNCTSTSVGGREPTPLIFPLVGTTVVYKMVVVTQGVEKLSLETGKPAAADPPLVTTSGAFDLEEARKLNRFKRSGGTN